MKPGTRIIIPADKTAVNKKLKKVAGKKRIKEKAIEHSTDDLSTDDHTETVISAARISGDMYHVVRKGDTLASISRKYSISADELKEINKLKSAKLKKGKRLLVKKVGPKTYIVKKGDNIWRIARKFDVDANELMELNEMSTPDLTVGQKLYLEEIVDPATTETIGAVVPRNFEEEIKMVAETEEFQEKDSPNKLVTFAKKLVNIPYKFGGNSILGIDCSAYVKKVYGLLGVELPRTAREQFKTGEAIEMDELSVGDLVFFRTYAKFPSHVGIYLGNNLFIHASSRGKKVTIDSLETPYYLKRFIGGKRLLTEREPEDKDHNSPS
jgi:LysM repeat protein